MPAAAECVEDGLRERARLKKDVIVDAAVGVSAVDENGWCGVGVGVAVYTVGVLAWLLPRPPPPPWRMSSSMRRRMGSELSWRDPNGDGDDVECWPVHEPDCIRISCFFRHKMHTQIV